MGLVVGRDPGSLGVQPPWGCSPHAASPVDEPQDGLEASGTRWVGSCMRGSNVLAVALKICFPQRCYFRPDLAQMTVMISQLTLNSGCARTVLTVARGQ